jgi:hypothetical protein
MKIFNIVFVIIFLVFAAVQYNDPDPLLWIAIYGIMAILCGMAATGRYYKTIFIVLFIGYAVYAALLLPACIEWLQSEDRSLLFDDIAKMQFPYIEETREFLGLVICMVVLLIDYFLRPSQKI